MRGVPVNPQIITNAPELAATLQRYAEVSGKKLGDVLAREGREWSWGLYGAFKRISPKPSKILADAKARSFAMGRRSNAFTPARFGISAAALKRAEGLLDGEKSDFFKVSTTGEGMLKIRKVRFGARRDLKKKTRLSSVLRGGRHGNRFAAGSLKARQVASYELRQATNADKSIKRLNLGALQAASEVSLRQRAAKGSTLAVQWLPKVYKRRSSSTVKRGPLVTTARNGKTMGRVDIEIDRSQPIRITLTGLIPGTDKQATKHGIVNAVAGARIADMRVYIDRKLKEAAKEAKK